MSDILSKIVEGIKELFQDAAGLMMSEITKLGDIPDWDSMASVNLQSFIEQNFNVAIPQDLLSEETSLGDVISYIRESQPITA